jgi:hypothetical protein
MTRSFAMSPMLQVSEKLLAKMRTKSERITENGSPAEKKAVLKDCTDELRI